MTVNSAGCGFNAGRLMVALVLASLMIFSFGAARAAVPASCDPKYWEAMKGKAWMEAQREIQQNQNLIYKADSVLEYTCFDQFLNVLAQAAPNLFSMTNEWGAVDPMPDMTNALETLVGAAAVRYVELNFNHDFLGGRRNVPTYTLGAVTPGNYNCDIMSRVWHEAKCMNFVNQVRDDFFDLSLYNGNDARQLPTACAPDARWNAKSQLAANTVANGYLKETYNTYAAFFNTTACAAPAIPTGVSVTRPPLAAYDEYVCVNPGCAHNRAGGCVTNPP